MTVPLILYLSKITQITRKIILGFSDDSSANNQSDSIYLDCPAIYRRVLQLFMYGLMNFLDKNNFSLIEPHCLDTFFCSHYFALWILEMQSK